MRIVQALRWLKDTLPTDYDRILARLSAILADRRHGRAFEMTSERGSLRCPPGRTVTFGANCFSCVWAAREPFSLRFSDSRIKPQKPAGR